MQKEILAHGRLYVSRQWICFYANIFRWETSVSRILCVIAAVCTMHSLSAAFKFVNHFVFCHNVEEPQYQSQQVYAT